MLDPMLSSSFFSGLVFPAGFNPLPPLYLKGKRKELEAFPYGALLKHNCETCVTVYANFWIRIKMATIFQARNLLTMMNAVT